MIQLQRKVKCLAAQCSRRNKLGKPARQQFAPVNKTVLADSSAFQLQTERVGDFRDNEVGSNDQVCLAQDLHACVYRGQFDGPPDSNVRIYDKRRRQSASPSFGMFM